MRSTLATRAPIAAPVHATAVLHRNVARAALEPIVREVHRLVPALAGGNVMPFIEAAYAVGLEPVHPRSELGVGFLANGIAWESDQPTLCLVITSAGVYG